MTVGIVGLGYVGLPLAVAFAEAGHEVVGVDSDPARIEAIGAGRSPVEDIADERLAAIAAAIEPSTEYAALGRCDAVILCVPTPLSGSHQPDLSYLRDSARSLAAVLRPGQLVVLESTSYPGTTREELLPALTAGGREAGRDFHLAFSPERIDPGRTDFTIRTTPKLVGGITAECTERAAALYREICDDDVVLSSPDTAELAKLLENIFRSVNIALVNELSQLCDRLGIDVWEVIEAAATKPFGFMRFDPGPGMGGHCLPVDPFYLAFKARENDFYPEFIELAGKANQAQPKFCVERIERILNSAGKPVQGTRVLILGASYKGGIGDTRESPALKIIQMLAARGAAISYHDPFVPRLPKLGLSSVELEAGLAETELLVIVTAHPQIDHHAAATTAPLTLDLRGVTRGLDADGIERL
jgi:UDP-N-acetyl-D-glucosamine dehydrogenase